MLLSFILCNFLVQMLKYFFKNIRYFLAHKCWKNHLKKFHTYGNWEGFFLCSPDCAKQPRTSFPFYEFFYTIISAKVSVYSAPICFQFYLTFTFFVKINNALDLLATNPFIIMLSKDSGTIVFTSKIVFSINEQVTIVFRAVDNCLQTSGQLSSWALVKLSSQNK